MSESQLQADVIELAVRLGYLWFHAPETPDAAKPPRDLKVDLREAWKTDPAFGKGLPDLVLLRPPAPLPGSAHAFRPGRLIFAELKAERGRLRAGQKVWLVALAEAGYEVCIWRPSDWSSGIIEEVLR